MAVCPKCGGYEVAHIEENGENAETYYCKACNSAFKKPNGDSIYPSLIKGIALDIKGFFTNSVSIKMQYNDTSIKYSISSKEDHIDYHGICTGDEWNKLSNNLFNECYLNSWKHNYYSPKLIDGTSWYLEVKLKRKHALQFHGCNGFPPYWNKLLSTFEPLFKKAGVSIEEFRATS